MSPNKFILKIYSITNLMVLTLYHNVCTFLYKFSQSSNCLSYRKMRIAIFCGRREYKTDNLFQIIWHIK
jgi:hypothetical protein